MTSSVPPPLPQPGGAVPPPDHAAVPPWRGHPGAVPPGPGYAGGEGAVPPGRGYTGGGPVPPGPGYAGGEGAVPPAKKSGLGKAGGIVGVIAVAVVIGLLKFGVFTVVREAFFGDKAKDAAVGDCIKADKEVAVDAETEAGATVVDCGSSEAAFTVAGRVDGVTDTKSTACDKFFAEKEEFFVYSSTSGGGYLLCLRPKA